MELGILIAVAFLVVDVTMIRYQQKKFQAQLMERMTQLIAQLEAFNKIHN